MVKVMRYFGYESAAKFRAEWVQLDDISREQLKTGVENGTLTY